MGQAHPYAGTALVVEDDRDLRDLAATVLEEVDLRAVEVEIGEDALGYFRIYADEAAFVFADVWMTRIVDGIDLARMIALKWPWIQMVVTSGAAGERLDDLPRSATFMPKPWRAVDVLMAAENAAECQR